MAIEFKSAPGAKGGDGGAMEIFALIGDNGKLGLVLLIVLVVIIYGIVVYLRTTPGYRVTDIKLKRGEKKKVAVKRIRPPTDEEVKAAEQR